MSCQKNFVSKNFYIFIAAFEDRNKSRVSSSTNADKISSREVKNYILFYNLPLVAFIFSEFRCGRRLILPGCK